MKMGKIRRANGSRRARSASQPCLLLIILQYYLILWRRPGRSAGESVTADAPLTLPPTLPPMFPEASKNRAKKTLIFGCLFGSMFAPFCLQIRSILASFFASVFEQVFEAFFLILVPFPTPRTFNFDALVQAPCDFSSFRHAAKNIKTNSKSLQNGF